MEKDKKTKRHISLTLDPRKISVPTFEIIAKKILTVGLSGIFYSDDGETWTHITAPFDSIGYLSCTYAHHLGLWIVGPGFNSTPTHAIITSPDGINWTTRTTPWDSLVEAWSVTYSPELELIVAIANGRSAVNEQVMISSDAISWTPISTYWDRDGGTFNSPEDVQWIPFLHKFMIAADGSRSTPRIIAVSDDGETWITKTTPVDPTNPGPNTAFSFGIGYSNDLVIVGGSYGEPYPLHDHTPPIIVSSDGETWNYKTADPPITVSANVYDCTWHDNLYVAGTNDSFSHNDKIMTSPDTDNWTGRDNAVSYINKVIWSPNANKFIAVGGDGPVTSQPCMRTSEDGLTWSDPFGFGMLFDVWDVNAV